MTLCIQFSMVPDAPGEIAVRVSDSDDATFSGKWPTPRPAGALIDLQCADISGATQSSAKSSDFPIPPGRV